MKGLTRRDAARLLGFGIGAGLVGAPALANAAPLGGDDAGGQAAKTRTQLDHIVWAVPDLDAAVDHIEKITGIRPVSGGISPGRSAPHNALFALGNGSYFEVFSPVRATGGAGTRWQAAIADGQPHIVSYAVTVTDGFADLLPRIPGSGVGHTAPRPMGRVKPDGNHLKWELVHLNSHPLSESLPFFIDWKGSRPHPSEDSPAGVTLERFEIGHPEVEELRRIFNQLNIDFPVVWSAKPSIVATLRGPKGLVRLES